MSCRCAQCDAPGLDVDWDWDTDGPDAGDEWLVVSVCSECNPAGILCAACDGRGGAPHGWGWRCDECRSTGLAFFGPENEESPQAQGLGAGVAAVTAIGS